MEKGPKIGGLEKLVEGQETEPIVSEKEQELRILEKKKNVLELLDKAIIMKRTNEANPDDVEKEKWYVEAKLNYEKAADEFRELESRYPEHTRREVDKLDTLDDVERRLNEIQRETKPLKEFKPGDDVEFNYSTGKPEEKKEAA